MHDAASRPERCGELVVGRVRAGGSAEDVDLRAGSAAYDVDCGGFAVGEVGDGDGAFAGEGWVVAFGYAADS